MRAPGGRGVRSRSGLAKSASSSAEWADVGERARRLVGRWLRRSCEVGTLSGIFSDILVGCEDVARRSDIYASILVALQSHQILYLPYSNIASFVNVLCDIKVGYGGRNEPLELKQGIQGYQAARPYRAAIAWGNLSSLTAAAGKQLHGACSAVHRFTFHTAPACLHNHANECGDMITSGDCWPSMSAAVWRRFVSLSVEMRELASPAS